MLATCRFSRKYFDYESIKYETFKCPEEGTLILASGFCIFHDKDSLQDKTMYEDRKKKQLDILTDKITQSISGGKPLLCIGFYLPDFNLSDLNIELEFTKPVYFVSSHFLGEVNFSKANFIGQAVFSKAIFEEETDFSGANFRGTANFFEATFKGETDFSGANFRGEAEFYGATFKGEAYFFRNVFDGDTLFNLVLFEQQNKVIFNNSILSNVSFVDSDITKVRFGDNITWGSKDGFTIIEEKWLELKSQDRRERYQFRRSNVSL